MEFYVMLIKCLSRSGFVSRIFRKRTALLLDKIRYTWVCKIVKPLRDMEKVVNRGRLLLTTWLALLLDEIRYT